MSLPTVLHQESCLSSVYRQTKPSSWLGRSNWYITALEWYGLDQISQISLVKIRLKTKSLTSLHTHIVTTSFIDCSFSYRPCWWYIVWHFRDGIYIISAHRSATLSRNAFYEYVYILQEGITGISCRKMRFNHNVKRNCQFGSLAT